MPTYAKGNKFITKFMVDGVRHTRMHNTQEEGEAWEMQARAALKLGKPIPDNTQRRVGGKDSNTLAGVLRSAENLHWGQLRGGGRGSVRTTPELEVEPGRRVHPCQDQRVSDAPDPGSTVRTAHAQPVHLGHLGAPEARRRVAG